MTSDILARLQALSDPRAVEGMARYGINPQNTYDVSIPNLRKIARETGTNHALAQELWASGIHEARIMASMIDIAFAIKSLGKMLPPLSPVGSVILILTPLSSS